MPRASIDAAPSASQSLLFRGALVAVGRDRCAPDSPDFARPESVSGYRFVFPRRAVRIQTGGARPFVSDPGVVEYYNDGQPYARRLVDPKGDDTDWYAIHPDLLREAVAAYRPGAAESDTLFEFTHAPTDPWAYARQRVLVERLAAGSADPLEIEETVCRLLDRVLGCAYRAAGAGPGPPDERELEIADRVALVLASSTARHLTLAEVARRAAVSVFHMCRIFRRVSGATIARRHLRLRLLASLEPLLDSTESVSRIAAAHGFASPSHYGDVFRRVFGASPAALRAGRAASMAPSCSRDRIARAASPRS